MSEGELKKQLKYFSPAHTLVKDGKVDMINGDLICQDDYIDLIIKEAKKDLLSDYFVVYANNVKTGEKSKYKAINNETFNKWFGASDD